MIPNLKIKQKTTKRSLQKTARVQKRYFTKVAIRVAAVCRDLTLRLQTLSSLFGKISRVDDSDNTAPFSISFPLFIAD